MVKNIHILGNCPLLFEHLGCRPPKWANRAFQKAAVAGTKSRPADQTFHCRASLTWTLKRGQPHLNSARSTVLAASSPLLWITETLQASILYTPHTSAGCHSEVPHYQCGVTRSYPFQSCWSQAQPTELTATVNFNIHKFKNSSMPQNIKQQEKKADLSISNSIQWHS